MILIDVNILLYAVFEGSARNAAARKWLDTTLNETAQTVALPWAVLAAFLRIATSPKAMTNPLTLDEALAQVGEWIALPNVVLAAPTARHFDEFARLLRDVQAAGNLVTDAHLAALAVEHGCRLASTDGDFARFHGLDWFNPLADGAGA